MKLINGIIYLATLLIIMGCEQMHGSNELDSIMSNNNLNIELKVDTSNEYEIENIADEDTGEKYLKITVIDEFSLRGKAEILTGNTYNLSVTLKNTDANPLIMYSTWKGLKTLSRSFTLAGTNGNPPISETQNLHNDWITYNETFIAEEGEESFMLSIYSKQGTFYIKDISIITMD